MTLLADLLSTVFERRFPARGAGRADNRPLQLVTADLVSARGEVSGQALAQTILERYQDMDDKGRLAFFHHLAHDLTLKVDEVRDALDAYEAGQTKSTYRAVMGAAEPPRQELIRRLNQLPGATAALVGMRADLLRLGSDDDALMALDLDFRHLFASWFNRGFLVLRPINWDTPARLLEKIIAYEAVHTIHSWADLRRRVEPRDRRCFALFHPAIPDEPLIFVEVALARGIPGSIQSLLAEERPILTETEADTAVFYSISNCQAGLAGISFGNSLIKQVVTDLSLDLPGLKTFVTLSPIPGLRAWISDAGGDPDTADDARLRMLAAQYLTKAKHASGGPLDPVAKFHLGNGASVHQVHARADLSAKGQAQSAGVMVNYLYDPRRISENHERFASQKEIAMSPPIRQLAASAEKTTA